MLYGAIYGDILGSTHEYIGISGGETHEQLLVPKSTFTDDSILTLAVADAIMNNSDIGMAMHLYATIYHNPMGGYGTRFVGWLEEGDNAKPYNSYGNGSAMRCCACAWAADNLDDALRLAKESALPTHNHPEGIKGAEAVTACIFLARTGHSKEEIRQYIHEHYYDMSRSFKDIYSEPYKFGAICQNTVPEAIISFLYSDSFEQALQYSMLTNKDTDTAAAITGSIAEAFYGAPDYVKDIVREKLDGPLLSILDNFETKYSVNN